MSKINNSEILFLYDAKNCNPNGDMDNENKPRMDWDTETNLVSDVRLKRYIRDYLNKVKGQELFVTSEAKKANDRVKDIIKRTPSKTKSLTDNEVIKILDTCIDAKLFGAVFATEGGNDHITGPIQFNWGYSLNKVSLMDTKTITSSFSSGEGIGKDYRVNYSLIAFSGGINGKVAKFSRLKLDDIELFDDAMIKAIPFNRTRSKIGQTPRLYLRIELINDEVNLKDLREYIELETLDSVEEENIRNISDFRIKFDRLINYLNENDSIIKTIYLWKDDRLEIDFSKLENTKIEEIK